MKRNRDPTDAPEEIQLDDVIKYARIHETVRSGGTSKWILDREHVLNAYMDGVPISDFVLKCPQAIKNDATITIDVGPAVRVDGKAACGTLEAPLVADLMKFADPAPFGKGSKTVLDPKIRLAYAIDGKRIILSHSMYDILGYESCHAIREWSGLGVEYLYLYKMHIYPEGGHFEPHVDTPHGPGHIASAILVLGSRHTGGTLAVTHMDKTERIEHCATFASWYTDCTHWIEPVTSGARVVLQFDLIHPGMEKLLDGVQPAGKKKNQVEDEEEGGSSVHDGESEQEYYEFFKYNDTPPLLTAPMLKALVAAVQNTLLEKNQNIALLLHHTYFNKGGLTPQTLKGSDKKMFDAFLGAAGIELALSACVLRRTDKTFEVGGLGPKQDLPTLCIPGGDAHDKTMELFNNPGAEFCGNESMDPDSAYLAAALVIAKK